MDENETIEKLCDFLIKQGWKIKSKVLAGERGIDVEAIDPNNKLFLIEAKGSTSSKKGSSRFGKPYKKTQVFDVASKGLMLCFHHLMKKSSCDIGFVYPANKHFSFYIDPLVPMLTSIGLTLFCVHANGHVEIYTKNCN
ncbi:MAG: hypothetical protein WC959_01280 [Kiritimatiellales bacterium]